MPPPASFRSAALVGSLFALLVFGALVSGGHPSGLVERGPFSSDFFDEQAHSLLDGRLDVDPAVASLEGFERDGHTYLYFGLVPALLRLPIAAVTDGLDGRLTQLSMLLALAVTLSATSRLLWRARLWQRPDEPVIHRWEPAVFGCFVAAVGLASPLLFLGSRPVVYHEVELWGTATTLVALDALLRWWDDPTRGPLVRASLAALVAFNTRASVGGGAVAALGLVLLLSLVWGKQPWRRWPALALAVLAPVVTYAAINIARFDTAFAVPFEAQALSQYDAARQATLEATDNTLFGLEFAPTALATYLRPDGVVPQRLFPWVTFRDTNRLIGNPTFDTVDRSTSLPIAAPGFLILGTAGGVALLSRRRRRDPWLGLILGAATGLTSTVTIAFIANRYLADFTPTLVVAASLGLWVVADRVAAARALVRRMAVTSLAAITVASGLTSLALAVQSQRLFILPDREDRAGFVAMQYDIDAALHEGPPPSVTRVETLGSTGRRGDVAIVGPCTSLYWSDGSRWWPLELGGDRGWALQGRIEEGTTTLISGPTWALEATTTRGHVQVRYQPLDGEMRTGPSLSVGDGVDHEIAIRLDSPSAEVKVELDGLDALGALVRDLSGPVAADPAWRSSPLLTPLCERLVGRLAAR